MHLVFFSHPDFLGSQSMPRYTQMLVKGMQRRGHTTEVLMPRPKFYKMPLNLGLRKWMGYLDQYIVFPAEVRKLLKRYPADTLFVFTDHALGPWVPLVANQPHVIHCHDFLAQRSAQGQITENPTTWTGYQYQTYIHQGYSKGKNFISVSQKTQKDLHDFLAETPAVSEVVYNGLNQAFTPHNIFEARTKLGDNIGINIREGYVLHVGGNQWYKNRVGVLEIYNAWRSTGGKKLPLLMVGKGPNTKLKNAYNQCTYKADIHFLDGLDDEYVRTAYAGASAFLFPSLAEGFGWPIAEAMVSGCPVITTNEAPMTEVAGNAGFLIPRRPHQESDISEWAAEASKVLHDVVELAPSERKTVVKSGVVNAARFDTDAALGKIEAIYEHVIQMHKRL